MKAIRVVEISIETNLKGFGIVEVLMILVAGIVVRHCCGVDLGLRLIAQLWVLKKYWRRKASMQRRGLYIWMGAT